MHDRQYTKHNTSYEEMLCIARRRGWVKWHHSGVLERLSVETHPHGTRDSRGRFLRRDTIFAEGLLTRRHWLSVHPVYFCISVPEPWLSLAEVEAGRGPVLGDPLRVPRCLRKPPPVGHSGKAWVHNRDSVYNKRRHDKGL